MLFYAVRIIYCRNTSFVELSKNNYQKMIKFNKRLLYVIFSKTFRIGEFIIRLTILKDIYNPPI